MTRTELDTSIADRLTSAYWPLHRSVLTIVGTYYVYVTFAHFVDERGLSLAALASISALTSIICFALLWARVKQHIRSKVAVELSMLTVGMLMLANVFAYHVAHFDATKLVYFPLISMAAAASCLTLRGTIVTVAAILACMFVVIIGNAPELVATYASISVATAFTSFGLATVLRGVVRRELLARDAADRAAGTAIKANEANQRLAHLDPLTALPNRRGLFALLERTLAAPDGYQGYAFGILDLDRFKAVNDVFGQVAGDRVLREAAARLSVAGRHPATIARLGGDEFGILVRCNLSPGELEQYAEDLARCLDEPFRIGATSVEVSGSCGFTYARRGDTTETLLDRADYAAHDAKRNKHGRAVVFGQQHEDSIIIERILERSMLGGNMDGEIEATFQPIFDGLTRQVIGYEALARWTHVELGPVSPSIFIPVAERLGFLPRITQAVARQSLALASSLPDGQRVSVNLSAHDLASEDAIRALVAIMAESPQRPCRLDFEITETDVMPDLGEVIERLLVLCANGCRISLDDFGTGHSSLTRVQRLPIDRIKVDRSFVTSIETDPTSQAIVRTTLDLCHHLQMECVIEGVETTSQVAALTALGARYFQGYYFGHPLTRSELLIKSGPRMIA